MLLKVIQYYYSLEMNFYVWIWYDFLLLLLLYVLPIATVNQCPFILVSAGYLTDNAKNQGQHFENDIVEFFTAISVHILS